MPSITYTQLTSRNLVRFNGEDARNFLHAQLTCDVEGLAADASSYGAYCTPKGRALATFLLWPTATGYVMQLPAMLREGVRTRLAMYILRSRVKAQDDEAAQFGLAGDGASAFIADWLGEAPARLHQVVHGPLGTAIRLPIDRYLLIASRDGQSELAQRLAAHTGMSESDWDALDIAAGIATLTPETREQFVPQMLNLDALGGVSFNKGCYPGQEIVARMHFLGRVKERLFRARVTSRQPVRPGDRLYGADLGAQAAGTVANAVVSDNDQWNLLAVIQLSSVAAGPVHLHAPDGPALELLTLPYAIPQK